MKKILLIGNPNTGKTTLFNTITKSNEHVGNWHGVTVDVAEKVFKIQDKQFVLADLPGIYSVAPLSMEEEVAVDYLNTFLDKKIINICDLSNLRRNLYLTLQLIEAGLDIVIFINDMGQTEEFDTKSLSDKLGVTVIRGDASNKEDVKKLEEYLLSDKKEKPLKQPYFKELPYELINRNIINKLPEEKRNSFIALRILESDEYFLESHNLAFAEKDLDKISKTCGFNKLSSIRYKAIDKLISSKKSIKAYGNSALDKIFLNKWLSIPIFFAIMLLVFYLTFFSFGAYFSSIMRDLIQNIIGVPLVRWLTGVTSVAWVVDLVEVGIIGGVGSLLGFLPQIVLLFFFLSVIEDSGYLARIAFMFEDIFAKVGLSGKSVYTLLMGFGCSTTAAMTARNMEDKNAKIKTALLTPYMSCSAKIPIYAVIGGAFFGASNVLIVFGLYMLGVFVALLLSLIFERSALKSSKQSFILEFPPYRLPSAKRTLKLIWQNTKLFLIRIGSLLISMNIIVWLLQSFSFTFSYVAIEGGESMIETLGKIIAPVFAPLGFDSWGAASALIAGLVAKEVVVSSIAMFNSINIYADDMNIQTSRSILDPSAAVFFSPASAISFMVFCLLYTPCIATISVLFKEIGKKWTFISILIQFAVAYFLAFIIFRLYGLVENFGAFNVVLCALSIAAVIISLIVIASKIKNKKVCSSCNGDCTVCNKR